MGLLLLALLGLLLLFLLTLLVMFITLKSPIIGIGGALSVAAVATLTSLASMQWLPPVAGGFLLGMMASARLRPVTTITAAGAPVGLAMALLYLRQDAAALRAMMLGGDGMSSPALQLPDGALTAEQWAQWVDFALKLVPAFWMIMVVAVAAMTYVIASWLFPRLGVSLRPLAPMASWRPPFIAIWTLAGGLGLMAVGWGLDQSPLKVIGANICVLHAALFFVQGIAVLRFALSVKGVPGRMQLALGVFLLPLIIAVQLQFVIAGLGLIDMWFDFRKLEQGIAPPGQRTAPPA